MEEQMKEEVGQAQEEPQSATETQPEPQPEAQPATETQPATQPEAAESCTGPGCPVMKLLKTLISLLAVAVAIGIAIYAISYITGTDMNLDTAFHGKKYTSLP